MNIKDTENKGDDIVVEINERSHHLKHRYHHQQINDGCIYYSVDEKKENNRWQPDSFQSRVSQYYKSLTKSRNNMRHAFLKQIFDV